MIFYITLGLCARSDARQAVAGDFAQVIDGIQKHSSSVLTSARCRAEQRGSNRELGDALRNLSALSTRPLPMSGAGPQSRSDMSLSASCAGRSFSEMNAPCGARRDAVPALHCDSQRQCFGCGPRSALHTARPCLGTDEQNVCPLSVG